MLDLHGVKSLLETTGRAMLDLSQSLDRKGQELNRGQKQLVAMVLAGRVQEATQMLRAAFITGDAQWAEQCDADLKDLQAFFFASEK